MMKALKKILNTAGVLLCAMLFLAGCGKKENKIRIGVSIPAADHGWTGGVVYWAQQAKKAIESKDPSVEILLTTAQNSSDQVNKIENLMTRGVKALVLLPHEPAPLTGICEQLKKRGIFLTVVDRSLAKEVQDLEVVGDNSLFGQRCAEEMAKRLKGKGNILVMEGIPCSVNTLRVEAFRKVMKKYPQIKVLESASAYWNQEKALKLMENFLQKHKKVDAVWAGDDDVLLGALKAYKESKRNDIQFFIGGGGSKQIIKMVLDHDALVPVDVTYPPRMIARGIEYAVAAAKGEKLPASRRIVIPADVITKENADRFYFPDSIY